MVRFQQILYCVVVSYKCARVLKQFEPLSQLISESRQKPSFTIFYFIRDTIFTLYSISMHKNEDRSNYGGNKFNNSEVWDTSAGTGKLCILGHLGLVFIWSCFVSCLLFLLFYVSLRNLCSGTCRKIRSLYMISITRRFLWQ